MARKKETPKLTPQQAFTALQKEHGPCIGKVKDEAGHNIGYRFRGKDGNETEILRASL